MDNKTVFAMLQRSSVYQGDIIAKALELKKVPRDEKTPECPFVGRYRLDAHLLGILEQYGIRSIMGYCRLTLTDLDNSEPEIPGQAPLNSWVFAKDHDDGRDFEISLWLKPYIDEFKEDGVHIVPMSVGQLGPGVGPASSAKMFDVLVRNSPEQPPHIRQFIGLEGGAFLSWNELGYPDIKSVFTLFRMASKDSAALHKLSLDGVLYPTSEKNEGHGIPYHGPETQALLIAHWREQLEDYKSKLII